MLNQLTGFDLFIMALLLLILPGAGILASLRKKSAEQYFLAGRSIRWWTVAGSVFGTNISSFHLIGMLGVGYSLGFVQAHYEIVFPAVLLLCYVFLASYRRLGLFTLSQYLEIRYSEAARLSYTILLVMIILVQLVGSFYVGSITLQWLFSGTDFEVSYPLGLLLIGLITCSYTIRGGMESIVITDTIQTLLMLAAGLAVAYFTFSQPEIGGFGGMLALDAEQPREAQKMHLYLPASHPNLPWTGIFTGLLLQHCFNFSTNQFIVQRVLAAASDEDARRGIIASGFLKLLVPFFSISTGVAAYYLFEARFGGGDFSSDAAFLKLIETVIPSGIGLSGLILAGLATATFSSVDSMMNAATTLLTVDVYGKYVNKGAGDAQKMRFGRLAVVALVAAAIGLALFTYTPERSNNFFLRVSAQLSYFTPGIMVAFLFGVTWPRAGGRGAVAAMLLGPVYGLGMEWLLEHGWGVSLNFLHRIGLTFLLCSLTLVLFAGGEVQERRRAGFEQIGAGLSLRSLAGKVGMFLGMQLLLLLYLSLSGLPAREVAWFGALAAFAVFVPGLRRAGVVFWKSDLFYAGLLSAASTAVYYYFA